MTHKRQTDVQDAGISPDWSTINLGALDNLPLAKWAKTTYRFFDEVGYNDFEDPPGYPSYLVGAVRTDRGYTPRRAGTAECVLIVPDHPARATRIVGDSTYNLDHQKEIFLGLWNRAAVSEERWEAWIQDVYFNSQNQYRDPHVGDHDRFAVARGTADQPDSWGWGYQIERFSDDPRLSKEWRDAKQALIEIQNRDLLNIWRNEVALPENHVGVQLIRRWLPDHQPRLDLIKDPPARPGNWWERLSKRPSPEECPGQLRQSHCAGISWCLLCGWREEIAVSSAGGLSW